MKEKLKTLVIIILLIISLILIIACRTNMKLIILPGHNPRSISNIDCDYNRFSDQFEIADSMFGEKYKLPLTR